jgi:hypothetical protein
VTAGQNGRVYTRKFDWDEARVRYQAGEPAAAIARSYGVSRTAVRRVVSEAEYDRDAARLAARQTSGRCADCDSPINPRSTRCANCSHRAKATTVRPSELRCSLCGEWKPDDAFHHDHRRPSRRHRRYLCRTCDLKYRNRYRRHPSARPNRTQTT